MLILIVVTVMIPPTILTLGRGASIGCTAKEVRCLSHSVGFEDDYALLAVVNNLYKRRIFLCLGNALVCSD